MIRNIGIKKSIVLFLSLMGLAADAIAAEALTEEKLELIYKKIERRMQKVDDSKKEGILKDIKNDLLELRKKSGSPSETVKDHFEKSYVTFAGGYDFQNKLKADDIYYEGELYAHLNLTIKWLKKRNLLLYAPVRLQVRQYKTTSSPVKTPSYNPGIKLYYLDKETGEENKDLRYYSIGFHHYSNGQSGPHYDPATGSINTKDGSFSSDYMEFSIYEIADNDFFHWKKLNIRTYLTGLTWEEEQTGYYEDALVELSGKNKLWGNKDLVLQTTIAYKFGRDYISPGVDAKTKDNFQYKAELFYKPPFFESLKVYVRGDYGYDYYNINYQSKMKRIQIGFAGHPF